MSADFIPESFAPASPQTRELILRVTRKAGHYRVVAVTRIAPNALLVAEGEARTRVPYRDDLLLFFQALKDLGPDSAILYDRASGDGWTTNWFDAELFVAHTAVVDDAR